MTEFDSKDRQIINLLQQNSRLSNVDLAEKVALSPSACLRRVQALNDKKVFIKFVALLNRKLFKKQSTAFIFIKLDHQSQDVLSDFEREVVHIPQVMECYLMAGGADYLLKLAYSDSEEFEHIYYQRILKLPGVTGTETRMSLRRVHSTTAIEV